MSCSPPSGRSRSSRRRGRDPTAGRGAGSGGRGRRRVRPDLVGHRPGNGGRGRRRQGALSALGSGREFRFDSWRGARFGVPIIAVLHDQEPILTAAETVRGAQSAPELISLLDKPPRPPPPCAIAPSRPSRQGRPGRQDRQRRARARAARRPWPCLDRHLCRSAAPACELCAAHGRRGPVRRDGDAARPDRRRANISRSSPAA